MARATSTVISSGLCKKRRGCGCATEVESVKDPVDNPSTLTKQTIGRVRRRRLHKSTLNDIGGAELAPQVARKAEGTEPTQASRSPAVSPSRDEPRSSTCGSGETRHGPRAPTWLIDGLRACFRLVIIPLPGLFERFRDARTIAKFSTIASGVILTP
jgi:hypothetical protein